MKRNKFYDAPLTIDAGRISNDGEELDYVTVVRGDLDAGVLKDYSDKAQKAIANLSDALLTVLDDGGTCKLFPTNTDAELYAIANNIDLSFGSMATICSLRDFVKDYGED